MFDRVLNTSLTLNTLYLQGHWNLGAEGACAPSPAPHPPPITFIHVNVNVPFFVLKKVDDKWFLYTTANQLSGEILRHLGCCNGSKLQSSWGFAADLISWVYSIPYDSMGFLLRGNYKCPFWTLSLQSLTPSDNLNPSKLHLILSELFCSYSYRKY